MTNTELINKMVAEYHNKSTMYKSMKDYYEGEHDVLSTFRHFPNRANSIVVDNFVSKFIDEEVQYSLGNPISFVSMSGDKRVINDISNNLFHWRNTHNQDLMRALEIYGKCFVLNYIDAKGRFSERILTPLQAICYCDTDGVPVRFIHFYKKKYDENDYKDVYYPDGTIETYSGNTLIKQGKPTFTFSGIPVSICSFDNINETIYNKIKSMQDGYNAILSNQISTIEDYRNAYLVITGVDIDEETEQKLSSHGLMNLPSNGASAQWLIKNMPDGYIQNTLNTIRQEIFSVTNHIDGNEKLQSNTSGTALRNRLVFLEQRCNAVTEIVLNTIYERIERLFEFLYVKNRKYNITDLKIIAKPCIPQDDISIIQGLVQLGIGENISRETALSQIPFIENPAQEIEKIKIEQANNPSIELDKISDIGGDAD